MKKGSFFINSESGEEFEIVGVFVKVKRESGEIFDLDASTLAVLFQEKLIRKVEKVEDAS